jgi:ceramide glucosyltransferase
LPTEQVGAMCCPYRGVAAEGGLWARLEAVGMSVEMTSGVLVARAMEGMQFVLGPTMAFRRETIRRMGGFKVTADYCADDFVLGNETFKLGQTVVLSHHAIDHMVINSSFMASLKHQVRWMKSTRFSRPKGHLARRSPSACPLACWPGRRRRRWGIPGLGAGALWLERGHAPGALDCGGQAGGPRPSWLGLLVLYPIRDLMGFGFWAASYLGSRILWRGRVFQLLPGGKMRAAD